MSEFEQMKQQVGGRSILITSWYDDSKQNWRASAPAYSYLASLITVNPATCGSRKAAVERLSGVLAAHFNSGK